MSRLMILALVLTAACSRPEAPAAGRRPPGDPERGKALLARSGCTVCHAIDGMQPAGRIGPHLNGIGDRRTLSNGTVENTPENLARFIQDPASLNPRTFMPASGLSAEQAGDIAAYLLTIR